MLQAKKMQYDKLGTKVVKSLTDRHFEAYYCSTREAALSKALELIGLEDTVAWGGSMTIDEIGLKKLLKDRHQPLIDRDSATNMMERTEMQHQALTADYFLMSSNAITEDGQLFNIDGTANRVGALCYGPRNVLIIAGMNKVVPDLEAAYSRVRHFAAPANMQRFSGLETPCKINGSCADCHGDDCICAQMVTTRVSRPARRIKVILIGEDLGL